MKILWVKSDFLHPTTRGGQIRTLEILRRLHRDHEVHYVAFDNGASAEGVQRSSEYCTQAYPVPHNVPPRGSPAFFRQLAGSVFSSLPLSASRYVSAAMRRQVAALLGQGFDAAVCDFLAPAPNIERLDSCVLFQHNVETMIWRRHAEHAPTPLHRWYFTRQADRMMALEQNACREAAHVLAVSPNDAALFRTMFGVREVSDVPTGVDSEYFAPRPAVAAPPADLIFVGSMDWMPNIDGVRYFLAEIMPLIWRRRPTCTLAVVGRAPSPEMLALAQADPRIRFSGTVPDIRPYLWNSSVSIVPLRIGGGTRLKIYESMAARRPVVSTTVGAEGLDVSSPENIRLEDSPQSFADACLELLDDPRERARMACAAWELVSSRYSWNRIAERFAGILERYPVRR